MTTDTPESIKELIEDWERSDPNDDYQPAILMAKALTRYAESLERTCEWRYDEDDDTYYTMCGESFMYNDGTREDNHQAWCGYCGARIVEVRE
jgi:hypothetical protein